MAPRQAKKFALADAPVWTGSVPHLNLTTLRKHVPAAPENPPGRAFSRPADAPNPSAKEGTRPKWSLRLLAAVGIPVTLLLACEAALRLAGCGYSSQFFISRKIAGQTVWTENHEFGRRFFPPG